MAWESLWTRSIICFRPVNLLQLSSKVLHRYELPDKGQARHTQDRVIGIASGNIRWPDEPMDR